MVVPHPVFDSSTVYLGCRGEMLSLCQSDVEFEFENIFEFEFEGDNFIPVELQNLLDASKF